MPIADRGFLASFLNFNREVCVKVFFFYVWPICALLGTTWLVLILWHGKQEYRDLRRRNKRFNSVRGRRLVHLLHLSGGVR